MQNYYSKKDGYYSKYNKKSDLSSTIKKPLNENLYKTQKIKIQNSKKKILVEKKKKKFFRI